MNDRVRNHKNSLSNALSSHLATHYGRRRCMRYFQNMAIPDRHGDRRERKLQEAYFIPRVPCVSVPPIVLTEKEAAFLDAGGASRA